MKTPVKTDYKPADLDRLLAPFEEEIAERDNQVVVSSLEKTLDFDLTEVDKILEYLGEQKKLYEEPLGKAVLKSTAKEIYNLAVNCVSFFYAQPTFFRRVVYDKPLDSDEIFAVNIAAFISGLCTSGLVNSTVLMGNDMFSNGHSFQPEDLLSRLACFGIATNFASGAYEYFKGKVYVEKKRREENRKALENLA